MGSLQNGFLLALSKTFRDYNKYGARSNKKLFAIHGWLAKIIKKDLGAKFDINSLGCGGERKLNGKYYPKNLDVSVAHNGGIVSTISFKFVTSNYKQNGNNYFENLLGETANIRRVNVGFAHLLVLRSSTPYYDKNKGGLRGKQKKNEILNNHDVAKYVALFKDNDFPHKPDVLGIVIVDIDKRGRCSFTNLGTLEIVEENQKIILNELSLNKFIDRFNALCRLKS